MSQGEIVEKEAHEIIDIERASRLKEGLQEFYSRVLTKGVDYSVLPGTPKPSLRKEGAELLTVGFRYRPISTIVSSQEITDPDKPFFHYVVKCSLYKDNELMGEAVGAANSRELQFAYKWVDANSVGKDTKTYGERMINGRKQVRVALEPWEIFSQQNKVLKMADKRAFVAAILRVTGASRIFTQDLEEEEAPAQQEQSITIDDVVYALHGYEDVLEVREDKAYIYVEAKAPLIISQIQEIQAIVKEFNGDIDLSVKDHKVWKIPK